MVSSLSEKRKKNPEHIVTTHTESRVWKSLYSPNTAQVWSPQSAVLKTSVT